MKKYFFLLFSFLIVGIGCVLETPPEPVADPNPVVVQKQPTAPDPLDALYAFCEKNGNNIVLQFNSETKTSRPFCVFSNNTQCDAVEYMQGACGPGNGAKIFVNTGNDVAALLRTCTNEDPTVCGDDGRNYTNRCVAELQHINIKHDGVCSADEQAETFVPSDAAPVSPVKKDAQGNIIPNKEKTVPASWLPLLYQMVESYGKQTPRSFVEECNINGQTMYYYEQGGPARFAVLYQDNGSVACFPRNDVTNACPTIITSGVRGCKQIWKDNR